jgi:hypothetical protein
LSGRTASRGITPSPITSPTARPFGARDARSGPVPHERERHEAAAGELGDVIAAALGGPRGQASGAPPVRPGERARRELDAVVRYRDSVRSGDAGHAARLAYHGDPADPQIAYAHHPNPTQDLVDVLHDLHRERWPISKVLHDGLAAPRACSAKGATSARASTRC